jgi:hypothetical protein
MNILYAIKQKGRIILLLLALGALELANCNAYNRNIAEMGNSVSEVYADRLMAQDYIYKLSARIHERKWALQESRNTQPDAVSLPGAQSLSILALLRDYEKTKFTPEEKIRYEEFRANIFKMLALQQRYANTGQAAEKNAILKSYQASLDLSLRQLEQLSGIQVQRGKHILSDSQKIVSFSFFLNQLDWVLIFVTLMIIMALIFATKTTFPKQYQNHLMN